jgi:Leucine-rich repeat (LRR) protein
LPAHFFGSFKRLVWLNVDNNHLRDLPVGSLPPSIVTLSATNNYITKFPMEITNNLPSLTWFTLRGNYIETLPGIKRIPGIIFNFFT